LKPRSLAAADTVIDQISGSVEASSRRLRFVL
jgi:hypothetical protein